MTYFNNSSKAISSFLVRFVLSVLRMHGRNKSHVWKLQLIQYGGKARAMKLGIAKMSLRIRVSHTTLKKCKRKTL